MLTLHDITEMMRDHSGRHAPGSESAQWGAYIDDARRVFNVMAYREDEARAVAVDGNSDFARYWTAIADDNYQLAAQYGDVPDEWTP